MDVSFPRAAFAGATLDHLFTGDRIDRLADDERDRVVAFAREFLDCDCEANPYCGHPEEKFCRWVLDARLDGHSPEAIVDAMSDAFGLYAYPADVLNFLDDAIRHLDAVADLAAVEGEASLSEAITAVRRGLEAGDQPNR